MGTSNLMSVKAVGEQKQSKRVSQSRFAFAAVDQANHMLQTVRMPKREKCSHGNKANVWTAEV